MTRPSSPIMMVLVLATTTSLSMAEGARARMAQGGAASPRADAGPSLVGFVAPAGWKPAALAKSEVEPEAETVAASSEEEKVEEESAAGEAVKNDGDAAGAQSPGDVWFEEENRAYTFIGVRARMVVIPSFMFGLYQADGGRTVVAPVFGLEYVSRRNGFEYDAWLTYGSYGMDDAPFKAKSDPDNAYEIVKSEIKVVSIGADFLWTAPVDGGVSFVYGGGAGIGAVFGDLRRNQAYPPSGTRGDPNDYVKCPGPGAGPGDYCGNDNDHYGDYTEPNWLDGGSKPVIFPWIALPQLGMRWKASRKVVLRVDTGLSFPGPFFFGVSGQYGLL